MGFYWIAHKDVSSDIVYNMVKQAYSNEGYNYMQQIMQVLKEMKPEQALVASRCLCMPEHSDTGKKSASKSLSPSGPSKWRNPP